MIFWAKEAPFASSKKSIKFKYKGVKSFSFTPSLGYDMVKKTD